MFLREDISCCACKTIRIGRKRGKASHQTSIQELKPNNCNEIRDNINHGVSISITNAIPEKIID